MTTNDNDTLLRLFLEYREMLRRLAWRILRSSPDEIDDVLQEAWIRAQQAWPPKEMRYAKTWLGTIVINLAISRFSQLKIRRGRHVDNDNESSPLIQRLACPKPLPDALVESNERIIAVSDAIRNLPEGYRTVVLLRFVAGMTEEEAAEHLGLAPGTIKSQSHKAIRRLQMALSAKAA